MLIFVDLAFVVLAVVAIVGAIKYTHSIRGGLIAALAMLSLALHAFPWSRLPISGVALSTLIATCGVCLAYGFKNHLKLSSFINTYTKILAFVAIVILLWIPLSPYPTSIGPMKALLFLSKGVLPCLAFFALAPLSRREFHVLLWVLVFCAMFLALRWTVSDTAVWVRTLYGGDFSPITAGRLIGMGAVLAFAWFLFGKGSWSYFSLVLGAALGLGMLLPGSRGPVMAAVVAVVMIGLISLPSQGFNRSAVLAKFGALTGLIFFFGGFYLAFSEKLGFTGVERVVDYFQDINMAETMQEARVDLLRVAWESFTSTAGLGRGTGGFPAVLDSQRIDGEYPHNIIAEFGAEQGVLGLVAIVVFLAISFRRLLWLMKFPRFGIVEPAVCAFWIFALMNAMVSSNIADNYHFWIASALLFLPRRLEMPFPGPRPGASEERVMPVARIRGPAANLQRRPQLQGSLGLRKKSV